MPSDAATVSPSDDDLTAALAAIRAEHPALGIAKVHEQLKIARPEWSVSEKRTRKALQLAGLTVAPPISASAGTGPGSGSDRAATRPYPKSGVIKDLDVGQWTGKIAVRQFGKAKGKGLVATERIEEGETIWKEDPFAIAPEWQIFDLQENSRACAYCTTPLSLDSNLVVACAFNSSSNSSPDSFCPARFCTRLCLSRSSIAHPLVCAARNGAARAVVRFARGREWLALHALAQCTARMLLANEKGKEEFEKEWKVFRALAELGMEERAKDLEENWSGGARYDRGSWKKAHQLYVSAFSVELPPPPPPLATDDGSESLTKRPAKAEDGNGKLARLLKKPLESSVAEELFSYDGFLRSLGRMSLNLEAHGGLYVLHSHLNHSCNPNVSVRHLDQRTALSRITAIARTAIEPGEELLITYVDPGMSVKDRRRELGQWGFGKCTCQRCTKEEKELKAVGAEEGAQMGELEKELRAGLGVL